MLYHWVFAEVEADFVLALDHEDVLVEVEAGLGCCTAVDHSEQLEPAQPWDRSALVEDELPDQAAKEVAASGLAQGMAPVPVVHSLAALVAAPVVMAVVAAVVRMPCRAASVVEDKVRMELCLEARMVSHE